MPLPLLAIAVPILGLGVIGGVVSVLLGKEKTSRTRIICESIVTVAMFFSAAAVLITFLMEPTVFIVTVVALLALIAGLLWYKIRYDS